MIQWLLVIFLMMIKGMTLNNLVYYSGAVWATSSLIGLIITTIICTFTIHTYMQINDLENADPTSLRQVRNIFTELISGFFLGMGVMAMTIVASWNMMIKYKFHQSTCYITKIGSAS